MRNAGSKATRAGICVGISDDDPETASESNQAGPGLVEVSALSVREVEVVLKKAHCADTACTNAGRFERMID